LVQQLDKMPFGSHDVAWEAGSLCLEGLAAKEIAR
jgi:hypothetical protein